MQNLYQRLWQDLQRSQPPPRLLRNIRRFDYREFHTLSAAQDPAFARELTASLYAGDFLILEKAFQPETLVSLRDRVYRHGSVTPPAEVPIVDGCPDFHYITDRDRPRPADGYVAIDHSYFSFRWNGDPLQVFQTVEEPNRLVKLLSGLSPTEFENNLPSDLAVDKIQVIHYPPGIGYISAHSDPFSRLKMILGVLLCEPGTDYTGGGFFLKGPGGKKVPLESEYRLGDITLVFPSMIHGVDPVSSPHGGSWESAAGRWFLSSYTIDSHCVSQRENAISPERWDKWLASKRVA